MKNITVKHYNNVYLTFDELTKDHFKLSPVWCEYHEPFELNKMKVSDDWIDQNIHQPSTLLNSQPYYFLTTKMNIVKREFLYVHCEIEIHNHKFEGYIPLSKGNINCFNIFLNTEVIVLLSENMIFCDENKDNFQKLEQFYNVNLGNKNYLTYTIADKTFDLIPSNGTFEFPLVNF